MRIHTQNKLEMSAYYGECCRTGSTRSLLSITYKRKSSVGQNGKQLLKHKPPFRAVLQIIHNWLVGLYKGRPEIMDFQRPDNISGSLPPAFQLTSLIQVSNIYNWRGFFSIFSYRAQKESGGFCSNGLFFDGFGGFSACEASDFAVQSRDHSRKPNDPFGRSLALRKPHFDSTLLSGQALSTVESFHDCLSR